MATVSRRHRRTIDIWPGWVDAISNLLIVVLFLLMIFVLAQFFLGETLSQRDTALRRLEGQVSELAALLSLERRSGESLSAQVAKLSEELHASLATRDQLEETIRALGLRADTAEEQARNASRRLIETLAAVAALEALKTELEKQVAAAASQAETASAALSEERNVSESARAQIALLNQQIAALRQQIAGLNEALGAAEKTAAEQEVQITSLGQRLNAALASRVQELSRYRSEFFGRLREVLGNQAGIRIVGDRFVFQSEVLFARGSATLGPEGQAQILQVAATLKEVADRIPADIEWILQVEGHTDRVPINTPQFPSNWELSMARAMSVLRLLQDAGIPARRLSAAGFAEYQPLEDRDDEEAYRRNRRIELKLTQR